MHKSKTTRMATRTRTILRIKRRRTESPISCIQLEGLVNNDNSDGAANVTASVHSNCATSAANERLLQAPSTVGKPRSFDGQQHGHGQQRPHPISSRSKLSSVALWKRIVEHENVEDGNCNLDIGDNLDKIQDYAKDEKETKKENSCDSYRIVNAMFVSGDGGDIVDHRNYDNNEEMGFSEGGRRSNKRRKLTLLDSSTVAANSLMLSDKSSLGKSSIVVPVLNQARQLQQRRTKSQNRRLKVLDPWTRIVDESLRSVQQGDTTVESHFRQLTTDPRFTLQDVSKQKAWMSWSLQEDGTNILHCCALWNDPSVANEVLQYFSNQRHNRAHYSQLRSELMEAVDADGRTPYEVAQMIGHVRVCEVLEIYGGDTSNFVYDMFYLDRPPTYSQNASCANHCVTNPKNSSNTKHFSKDGTNNFNTAKLYCDHDGANIVKNITLRAELSNGVAYCWTSEGELVFENYDDENEHWDDDQNDGDDMDSNCEEYGANDYPDEDLYDDDDDEYCNDQHYYQRPSQRYNDYDCETDLNGYDEYDWEQD
mmetsp:Transcript_23694/g.65774  ORF Transcript_23694/g.65774 Transcript_23694/m.65774 type:complete len:538 (+) Transcript_23694:73-1686(+)